MVVNKFSYRMSAKIKKYVKILMKAIFIHYIFFLLSKDFFDKLYIIHIIGYYKPPVNIRTYFNQDVAEVLFFHFDV